MQKPKIIEPQNWWLDSNNEILVGPTGAVKIGRVYEISPTNNGEEHGQCIIKAVQSTYGADINPEKITELIDAFHDIIYQIKYPQASSYSQKDGVMIRKPIIQRAVEALKNIKFE